jgi:uncharacterized membrane protein YphA (DoxX/SURF4 family)
MEILNLRSASMNSILSWLLGASASQGTQGIAIQGVHMAAGLLLIRYHGCHKLKDGLAWRAKRRPSWPFRDEIAAAGFPFVDESAWLATAAQLAGGLCLLLGLFTRPAALILAGTLLGAVYTTVVLRKESQLALVYLVLVLSAAGLGPGPWSLDAVFFR